MPSRPDSPPDDDTGFDTFLDSFMAQIPKNTLDDIEAEQLSEWVWRRIGAAYSEGRQSALADEALARDYAEQKITGSGQSYREYKDDALFNHCHIVRPRSENIWGRLLRTVGLGRST